MISRIKGSAYFDEGIRSLDGELGAVREVFAEAPELESLRLTGEIFIQRPRVENELLDAAYHLREVFPEVVLRRDRSLELVWLDNGWSLDRLRAANEWPRPLMRFAEVYGIQLAARLPRRASLPPLRPHQRRKLPLQRLHKTLALREAPLQHLHRQQISLLPEWRAASRPVSSESGKFHRLFLALQLTINAISSGLRETG